MKFSGYELLWLFFLYSFLGWVLETVFAAIRRRSFTNRGLINGPLCTTYGVGALTISISLANLDGIWLFAFAAIYGTVIEWIAGHLIERLYQEKWWDYSGQKWNLDGYICLGASVLWGILGFGAVKWFNRLGVSLLRLCPGWAARIGIWLLVALLAADILASYLAVTGRSGRFDRLEEADGRIANVTARLGRWITDRVEHRIEKAYPERIRTRERETGFAAECSFYKVVLLFFIGAFLGDIIETLFCRATAGVWMSRSSVIWGPFSIVWGLAIAAVTALLYQYKDRSDSFLFWAGTFLGGAYEYLCSVFTELVFGKVFWDYSHMPFNLDGRVNLLYCFFWGIAVVAWFKILYPPISARIERLPERFGKVATWGLIFFMCCNITATSMALLRHDQRSRGVEARQEWQHWMDTHYDDARMERIYPNAKPVA